MTDAPVVQVRHRLYRALGRQYGGTHLRRHAAAAAGTHARTHTQASTRTRTHARTRAGSRALPPPWQTLFSSPPAGPKSPPPPPPPPALPIFLHAEALPPPSTPLTHADPPYPPPPRHTQTHAARPLSAPPSPPTPTHTHDPPLSAPRSGAGPSPRGTPHGTGHASSSGCDHVSHRAIPCCCCQCFYSTESLQTLLPMSPSLATRGRSHLEHLPRHLGRSEWGMNRRHGTLVTYGGWGMSHRTTAYTGETAAHNQRHNSHIRHYR